MIRIYEIFEYYWGFIKLSWWWLTDEGVQSFMEKILELRLSASKKELKWILVVFRRKYHYYSFVMRVQIRIFKTQYTCEQIQIQCKWYLSNCEIKRSQWFPKEFTLPLFTTTGGNRFQAWNTRFGRIFFFSLCNENFRCSVWTGDLVDSDRNIYMFLLGHHSCDDLQNRVD